MFDMPVYRSHKLVQAAPIISATAIDHQASVVVRLGNIEVEYIVPGSVFARGWPVAGDYLVKYRDGYLSWSPKKEFEDGYTKEAA